MRRPPTCPKCGARAMRVPAPLKSATWMEFHCHTIRYENGSIAQSDRCRIRELEDTVERLRAALRRMAARDPFATGRGPITDFAAYATAAEDALGIPRAAEAERSGVNEGTD